jgi:hypothetical protein
MAPQGTINETGQTCLGLVGAHGGNLFHVVQLDHTVKPRKNDSSEAWRRSSECCNLVRIKRVEALYSTFKG